MYDGKTREEQTSDLVRIYCITGIFPGTFISRKMMISTFSVFCFPRHANGCTDTKFSVNGTQRFGSCTFIASSIELTRGGSIFRHINSA